MSNDEYTVNWVYWEDPKKSLENTLSNIEVTSVPKMVVDCVVDTVREGVEKVVKSTPMYKMGHNDGKKEGVVETSEKCEDKLIKQAKFFEEQIEISKEDIYALEALIKEYEKYIEEKEAEFENLLKEKLKDLKEIKEKYEKLLKIKC